MIDSLSPFQVPRMSGTALCAAAGAAEKVANTTIQASFDMAEVLQAFIVCLLSVKAPYRDQRGNGREQEEAGEKASVNIPFKKPGEIIEHICAERNCKAVDVRVAFPRRQNGHDGNCGFKDDGDDEHCEEGYVGKYIIPAASTLNDAVQSSPRKLTQRKFT